MSDFNIDDSLKAWDFIENGDPDIDKLRRIGRKALNEIDRLREGYKVIDSEQRKQVENLIENIANTEQRTKKAIRRKVEALPSSVMLKCYVSRAEVLQAIESTEVKP